MHDLPGHHPSLRQCYIVTIPVEYSNAGRATKTRVAKRQQLCAFAFENKTTLDTLEWIDYQPLIDLVNALPDERWHISSLGLKQDVILDEHGQQNDMIPHRVFMVKGKLDLFSNNDDIDSVG